MTAGVPSPASFNEATLTLSLQGTHHIFNDLMKANHVPDSLSIVVENGTANCIVAYRLLSDAYGRGSA
jgi:hypothetical protein